MDISIAIQLLQIDNICSELFKPQIENRGVYRAIINKIGDVTYPSKKKTGGYILSQRSKGLSNIEREQLMNSKEIMSMLTEILEKQTPYYEGEKILVNDFIEKWLDTQRELIIKPNTYDMYETKYRLYIKPFFEGKTLTEVTYDDIIDLMKLLTREGRSKAYIRDTIVCIVNKVFKEAEEIRHIIPSNPCKGIKIPKEPRVSKTTTATDGEIVALYHAARYLSTYGRHYWIAVPLLAMTGMRRGELLALTWDDIKHDIKTGQWYINVDKSLVETRNKPTLNHHTKTPDGIRMIAIPPILGQLLMEFKEETQGSEKTYIISQKTQDAYEAPHNFMRSFKHWRKLAGIKRDITPHSFRRNYATRLFLEHTPLDIVKRQGGWKDDRMPSYYADKAMTEPLKIACAERVGEHWEKRFLS